MGSRRQVFHAFEQKNSHCVLMKYKGGTVQGRSKVIQITPALFYIQISILIIANDQYAP